MRGRSSGKTGPPVPGLTRVGGGAIKIKAFNCHVTPHTCYIITAVIKLEKCTQETRSNLVNRSHAPAPAPGGRPVAPVASRVVKLIFTTKRLPLPAAPAPAPALLQDPLLNNCDSVGGDCVTLRSSWRVYCNPRRRLRNRWVPLDCKPGRIPETGAGVGRAMHKRGVRRAGCSEALRTGSAKYCEAIARFRAARAPNPTT